MMTIFDELEIEDPFEDLILEPKTSIITENAAYKVYSIRGFLENQSKQYEFFNEYSISKQA